MAIARKCAANDLAPMCNSSTTLGFRVLLVDEREPNYPPKYGTPLGRRKVLRS